MLLMVDDISTKQADLEVLWGQFHDRLCRFVCSRMANEQDVEDILQNVFLRIHANLDKLRNMDKLESWIYQITRNSLIDYYRSRKVLVNLDDVSLADEDPEEDSLSSLAPCIRDSIEMLPEPYRQALVLTEYEGLSQKQLAERLGISFSGAKSRVQRARQKVRDLMLTYCHFELESSGITITPRQMCCCCNFSPEA